MRRVNALVWGIVLLLAGAVLLLWQVGLIDLGDHVVWPIFLLALGVVFHLYCFIGKGHNEGLLVPGGILLVYGAMFLFSDGGDVFRSHLWPLFILGPAFGLFELYAFSLGRRGSMVPVFILTAIGGGLLLMYFAGIDFRTLIAVLAICLGAGMMISAFTRGARRSAPPPPAADGMTGSADTKSEPSAEAGPERPPEEQPKP